MEKCETNLWGVEDYETKLWLIGDKKENLTFWARVSYDYRATIARHSRYTYANSRRILTDWRQKWESDIPGARIARVSYEYRASVARHSHYTCMRTPGELWQYLQQYSCDIRKCVVKNQFSVIPSESCRYYIRVFSRNFESLTSRQQSQPSEMLALHMQGQWCEFCDMLCFRKFLVTIQDGLYLTDGGILFQGHIRFVELI